MKLLLIYSFKTVRRILRSINKMFSKGICHILFLSQNVRHKDFQTEGIPYVSVAIGGKCSIGTNFKMNNNLCGNPIGRSQKCIFFIDKGGLLTIGDNVGISQAALICYEKITIGDNVKIGGGVCIYDTDFHSLNAETRRNPVADNITKLKAPVEIKRNAFIGAHSTILKGVIIGENSIIGACSVVTKSVPDNEIWAGNPAKMIRLIE